MNETTRKVYLFIKDYINKKNYSPSVREIMEGVNLKSPATSKYHIDKLIDLGLIKASFDEKGKIIARTMKLGGNKNEK